MLRYLFAALFAVSTLVMAVLAVMQHRDGRLSGSNLAIALGSSTSTLVVAGALALP